jgi:TPP-dependent pyruvate/acetoin dehydrogenase alpha subunit
MNGSNKIYREGLPKERTKQPRRPHRSPGWIKAREERSARRAEDPIVQARAHDQHLKASELEKVKETQKRVDKMVADQKKSASKKTSAKWEKN